MTDLERELAAALRALFSNPHIDLGDLIYTVRDRELQGWNGPAVTQWSAAVTTAQDLLNRIDTP